MTQKPIYRRVLLKLSGEALMGKNQSGIDPKVLDRIALEITEIIQLDVQVGIVIGGGNLFRGTALYEAGIGRITGDHIGMLATVMNSLALRDALERINTPARIMSAVPLSGLVDHYDRRKAIHHLQQGRAVIFSAGTGNPLFTTDSAASLRGIEIDADVVLKATKVDGVYSADPMKHVDPERYHCLTYDEVIEKGLGIMDLTAICLCRDHDMPLRVFNMNKPHALKAVILGLDEGTLIVKDKEKKHA